MIKSLWYWSQETLLLTTRCQLQCDRCSLRDLDNQTHLRTEREILGLIQSGAFFKDYKRARLFNVIGGDPFCHESLLTILRFLKHDGRKVRLWTHGCLPTEFWMGLLPFIDEIMMFIPSGDPDQYREITGLDGIKQVESTIRYLKEKGKKVSCHSSVRQDTIQFLPELYDFTFLNRVPLLLHIPHNESLDKDSQAHIKRFRFIKNVMILPERLYHKPSCLGYPLGYSWVHKLEAVQYLLNELNPYFYLQKKYG
ncbi:hypothetical protein DID77_02040 [Candidatus Marinamargulisbacteria bacterium SCGC AG-439-L15]|nr:hypothetical protein DID77_02040 [Candidatus Marinamargulisbacteria bacterium SCGC AG-439-L15]